MARFKRGSEWRKWDLHLHPPGTKLSDGYDTDDVGAFCDVLEASDVAVFGITDYFSFDGYFNVRDEFKRRHPESSKLLLPNLEVRLVEALNKSIEQVDAHLIFRPEVGDHKLLEVLSHLKTQITDDGLPVRCSALKKSQFQQATVSRSDIAAALAEVFGKDWGPDKVIIVVPANGNGIRALPGAQRKAALADEVDKFANAIFGSSSSSEWFLRDDRFEDDQVSSAKPVLACSDAHSMAQLNERLGKSVDRKGELREVTWVKADPTYEGLLQTLVEPDERVRIQPEMPDEKADFKRIASVRFEGTTEFPTEPLEFNGNLVSVIGSRSSGKSALLAYISHSIDPTYTVKQQVASGLAESDAVAGPAAGLTWGDVKTINCKVTWGSPEVTEGKVVYIPQNSLFRISEQPKEITEKILPTLYRLDPAFESAHQQMTTDVERANAAIVDAVRAWFLLNAKVDAARAEVRELGDAAAIRASRAELEAEIQRRRAESDLSADDVAAYETVVNMLIELDGERTAIEDETRLLELLVEEALDVPYVATEAVTVAVDALPGVTLPVNLRALLEPEVEAARSSLLATVREQVVAYRAGLDARRQENVAAEAELRETNAALIQRNQANAEVERLIGQQRKLDKLLQEIDQRRAEERRLVGQQQAALDRATDNLAAREEAIDELVTLFEGTDRALDGMEFLVETGLAEEQVGAASGQVDRRAKSEWVDRDSRLLRVDAIRKNAGMFLRDLAMRNPRPNQGVEPVAIATIVLTLTRRVEFVARMEGDRIGGFKTSSMTPGKQALFALTLIINESEDEWPLLLDQPEDDLDSRSIFKSIVPFLMKRKRKRQILMVSHDANLVIGADSEQVIVANRHGDDRKNRDDRTFDYLPGSLEWTRPVDATAKYVLESAGTREHACEILDGGEEAFRKRRQKYKI